MNTQQNGTRIHRPSCREGRTHGHLAAPGWLAKATFAAALMLVAGLALAQMQTVSITVESHEEYGPILVDSEGRALYLFTSVDISDPEANVALEDAFVTEGVREEAAPCTEGCLENWPPVEANAIEAVGDVDRAEGGHGFRSDLLYVAEVDGTMQAVYNGWPLYYFATESAGDVGAGHGLGTEDATWYLVNPRGGAALHDDPSGSSAD